MITAEPRHPLDCACHRCCSQAVPPMAPQGATFDAESAELITAYQAQLREYDRLARIEADAEAALNAAKHSTALAKMDLSLKESQLLAHMRKVSVG